MGPQDTSESGASPGGVSASEMAGPPKRAGPGAPRWEAWELDVVRRTDLTVKQLQALLPLRSQSAIHFRRRGLKGHPARGPRRDWQRNEVQIVQENAHLTSKDMMALLPGRTAGAIYAYRRTVLKEVRRPDWRGSDEKLILKASPDVTDLELAVALGRSPGAVGARRLLLGRYRPRRPVDILADSSVPPLIQDIRARAREHGIWLRDLERAMGADCALKPSHQPKGPVPAAISVRAVELLGGELYAVWED